MKKYHQYHFCFIFKDDDIYWFLLAVVNEACLVSIVVVNLETKKQIFYKENQWKS